MLYLADNLSNGAVLDKFKHYLNNFHERYAVW